MRWHNKKEKEVLEELHTQKEGLTNKEVQKRFAEYGKNIIKKEKKKSVIILFLSQLHSLLIYVLIAAVILSAILGHTLDALVIGIIIIINASIGFIQEYKANETIEKLRRSLEYKVIVQREGKQQEISSQLLVPGDIVHFDTGDKIPADCRILQAENLKANEAVLTGESFPVNKEKGTLPTNTVLAERTNILYAGTIILSGKATAVITSTGENTEFGKLAKIVKETEEEKMPLEKKMDTFSKNISIGIIILLAILFLIGISRGIEIITMFLTSLSLAVGAIPEGLPAVIAITLAVAIKQMHKTNVLIRKLPAAETLGRATVICTDKTGTLTEEELQADKVYTSKKLIDLNKTKTINKELQPIIKIGLLCNNARDEKDNILGDPLEAALIGLAKKYDISKKELTEKNPRIKEYSFDSKRKMMSIIRQEGNIKTSYVKGAPRMLLEQCSKEYHKGKISIINKKRRKELEEISKKMESSGLRVLGLAFRQITKTTQQQAENNLTFTGFIGMIDPPRKEVAQAIQEAQSAGITIKIITGDSALTTKAIAQKIGLEGEAIEGKELDEITDDKWDELVRTKTIFSRVTPEQKLRIVQTLKEQKEIVAVTGDGVNDILALKKADIGVSMGIRGSDVARDSSDIVLLDDNFASIIAGIKQGRRVFDNIKKSIKFLFSTNLGEVLLISWAIILGLPLPFLPLAILWINLITDSLPALALSMEPAEKDIMKDKPTQEGLLEGIWSWIILAGILSFVSGAALFYWALQHYNLEIARTMAVTTIVFFEVFFALSCKTKEQLIKTNIFNNKWLLYAIVISAGIHLIAVYTVLGSFFGFTALTINQLLLAAGVGINGLIIFEIWKFIKEKTKKSTTNKKN